MVSALELGGLSLPGPVSTARLPPVSPAVITLQFDPTLSVAGRLVRWETLALAVVIVVSLALAAWLARRVDRSVDPSAGAPLRTDDLLYMVVGALPGAVIGGRILHGLDFAAYYVTVDTPAALLDPARGSLSLLGAVIGGTLTGAYVGWLIGAPLKRWLDVAIVPLLLAIGLGKLANLLGGAGQGAITDVPWAVAFTGGGPWRSLGADLPAHPSQVYEAAWTLAGILLVLLFTLPALWLKMPAALRWRPVTEEAAARALRYNVTVEDLPPPGAMAPGFLFGLGLGWWALGRVVVGFTWRDERVLLGLNAEQLAALVVLLGLGFVLARHFWLRRDLGY
jgi:prolipoprotein diacylglyceryltransferase